MTAVGQIQPKLHTLKGGCFAADTGHYLVKSGI
jgi:hypothetical protein